MYDIENNGISRLAHRWLLTITLLCAINAVLLFVFKSHNFRLYSMLFPWVSTLLFDIGFGIITIMNLPRIKNNDSRLYISIYHKKIYNNLYPNPRFPSYTPPIAGIKFILGKYDDGTDIRLNTITRGERLKLKLICLAHLLVLIAWGANILIIKLQ
jgi:hypothetical protein